MIPLALLAGLPTTSCFCAEGGFKLFCGGHFAGAMAAGQNQTSPDGKASPSDAQRNCPACAAKDSAARTSEAQPANCDLAVSNSCCGEDQLPISGSPTACCQLIESTVGALTSVVALPDFTALGLASVVEIVTAPRLAAAALARPYDVFETGPPVDRVIVLCSLLI